MSSVTQFGNAYSSLQAGTINGPVQFHAAPERPETPPNASCNIPFPRDLDFVDRGTLLDEIREQLSAPSSRIALVGLGGVGKTQLAIEHCYRTAKQSPESWVFWVHASTTARLEQGFEDIADLVKLAGRNDPQANVFKLVHNWLQDKRHGKWLLVLDNADDASVLAPSSSDRQQHLSSYLPASSHGAILVTSRTKQAASRLVEGRNITQIEPMHEAVAQALLHKKLGSEVDKTGIDELAAALEHMPLALVQAAAYILNLAPHYSVRQYLGEFRKSEKNKASLLNQEGGHLRRDAEARNSVITTWQISFDHVRSTRRSATDLLSLMSFFDRQGIPEALLRNSNSAYRRRSAPTDTEDNESDEDDRASEADIDHSFRQDIVALRDYSFISASKAVRTYEMHSLVQLATRRWIKSQGQLERWKQQYVANLCAKFPKGEYKNWATFQALFPHAMTAIEQRPESREHLEMWASLLYNAAWYAWKRGSTEEAKEMSVRSLEVRTGLYSVHDSKVSESMGLVAIVRASGGRWEEAEELQVRVMETSLRGLGDEHPDTLRSMGNLAVTFEKQGRWKEAEELQVRVMETSSRVLGDEHPDTLRSMDNLASTYSQQGRWKEAEELQVRARELKPKVLGDDHPSTLNNMRNLAMTYRKQGRWKEAEELSMQVLDMQKRVLGVKHPSTLSGMKQLAVTLKGQERFAEAVPLLEECYRLRKEILGPEHPMSISSLKALGRWTRKWNRNDGSFTNPHG